jgi:hypothetical protein
MPCVILHCPSEHADRVDVRDDRHTVDGRK